FSRMVSNSSLGRARLPTWVVRIRLVLLFTRPCYLRSVSVLGILPHGRIGVCWRCDEGPGHGAGRPRGDRGDGSPSRGRRRGGQGPLLRHLPRTSTGSRPDGAPPLPPFSDNGRICGRAAPILSRFDRGLAARRSLCLSS